MNILPGEPVPPGFEDEVNRVAEIQQAIDQYKGNALVGLEYTVELYEENREPSYICLLCDKRGDPRTVMQHWTSFNHRMKYLTKHYPTAIREINPVRYKPNSNSIMIGIVQSLSEAIEDHHGRLTLSVVSAEDFRRERKRIENEINGKLHFDERNGPNFLNVIDRSLWESKPSTEPTPNSSNDKSLKITLKANAPKRSVDERPSQREDLDEISSEDEVDASKKSKKEVQQPAYRTLPRVRRSPPFEEDRGSGESKGNDKKLPTPKELSLQASHIAQERYKWEKYRCMLEIQLKQMEKIQQDYEKNPEKHPLYPEEWKKFWNRRYKELQAEKKVDPNKHDYKPEWILFWTKRMQDLFNDEVEKKKKEIKVKLGLPENAEEKVEQLKEKYKVQVQNRNLTGRSATSAPGIENPGGERRSTSERERISKISNNSRPSTAVIDISDSDSEDSRHKNTKSRSHSRRSRSISPHARRDSKRSRGRSRSRSRSPRSSEHLHDRHYNKLREREAYDRERHIHMVPGAMRMYPPSATPDYYGVPPPFGRSRFPTPAHYPGISTTGYRVMDPQQYPQYERSPSPSLKLKREELQAKKPSPEPEDDGPLTVVAVLRLLTALEEHLGSLGPKVVDMLGKALALEKVKANSADEMLINDDNCVFFETIKEKLKGLLIADVLEDQQKVRAVKRAIKNIAAIVHQVNSKGITSNKSDETLDENQGENGSKTLNKNKNQIPSIKDLPFDRQIVSTKLAAALVMQGREDVSTEDMDKLIYIFILMTKLSKDKAEIDESPLYMKDILPELGIVVPKPVVTPSLANVNIPALVDDFLENEVNALVQEVEDEMSNDINDKDSKNDPNASMLESLTDSDLQTLLQNFKHLSTEEQHHLIAHLKKLESADPARVEKLRKFVNLAELADAAAASTSASAAKASTSANKSRNFDSAYDEDDSSTNTRFKRYNDNDDDDNESNSERFNYSGNGGDEASERRRTANVSNPNKFSLDDEDDEDDYNFEDVFKVASNNVKNLSEERKLEGKLPASSVSNGGRSADSNVASNISPISSANALTFNPAGLKISLSDTQNLIANLMGSLQQSNNSQTNVTQSANIPKEPLPTQAPINKQQPAQFAQPNSMPFYQQQQQRQQQPQIQHQPQMQPQPHQSYASGFQPMGTMNDPQAAYYNQVGGYNNAAGYPGYDQWNNGQQMTGYGMPNFMGQPQQQPQPAPHQMGYNMYGGGN